MRTADFYLCTTGRAGFGGGVTGCRGRHGGQTLEFSTNTNFKYLLNTLLILQINTMEMLQQKYSILLVPFIKHITQNSHKTNSYINEYKYLPILFFIQTTSLFLCKFMDQEVIIFASWWLIVLKEFRHSVICLHNRQSIQQHKTWGTTQVQTVNQGQSRWPWLDWTGTGLYNRWLHCRGQTMRYI